MTVHLSPAAAAKLGIDVPAARRKTTRKAVPTTECSATRCCTCQYEAPRQCDEDRHYAANPTHRRWESVL